jgi:transposase
MVQIYRITDNGFQLTSPPLNIVVIRQLLAQHQELQEEFKTVHRQYDQTLEKNAAISELKRDIKSLEEEKVQIIAKIGRHQSKLESMVRGKCISHATT